MRVSLSTLKIDAEVGSYLRASGRDDAWLLLRSRIWMTDRSHKLRKGGYRGSEEFGLAATDYVEQGVEFTFKRCAVTTADIGSPDRLYVADGYSGVWPPEAAGFAWHLRRARPPAVGDG